MQPIHFEGAKTIGKPPGMTDEQCMSISAMPVDYEFTGEDDRVYQSRFWVECWKPSKEDIEAINRGDPIWIQIHCGQRLVPIAVFTLDENGQSNDAN